MCYGILQRHDKCGCGKEPKVVDFCEDSQSGTCTLIPIHIKRITVPSLCIKCFREEEARIDDRYHEMVALISSKIADYEAAQSEIQIRGRSQGAADETVVRLERELLKARKWRYRAIQVFREDQGVWADG